MTLDELITYNDALNEFQLATCLEASGTPAKQRGELLDDALRLKTPRLYKVLSQEKQKDIAQAFQYKDAQGFNLLSRAILTGHWGAAHKLVAQGVYVLQPNITRITPMECAVEIASPNWFYSMLDKAGDRMLPDEQDMLETLSKMRIPRRPYGKNWQKSPKTATGRQNDEAQKYGGSHR